MQTEENYAQLKVKEIYNKQSLKSYSRSHYEEHNGGDENKLTC